MKFLLRAIPSSLALGALLAAIQPGNFLRGWLLFSFLLLLSFYVLRTTFSWATLPFIPSTGSGQRFHPSSFIFVSAFILRLALGITLYIALPLNTNGADDHRAGYVFFDAYRRDTQAWELAISNSPILSSFDKTHYTDQYGGLLALSAAGYRYLSPDAHRPLLPVLFGALTASLGLAFLWKAAVRQWDEKVALAACIIYALYPESILLGASQMREPFLMGFMCMALYGFVTWRARTFLATTDESDKKDFTSFIFHLSSLTLGLLGMLLISPVAALLTLVIFAGWAWVTREHARTSWIALSAALALFLLGIYLLAWGLQRDPTPSTSPVGVILNFARDAVKWDVHQLERGSGWVQKLFSEMPDWLRPLFVIIYGITQPVLPAAFIEPTTLTLRLLGIFRALGWYALVPLLFFAPVATRRLAPEAGRRLWTWLLASAWLWIIIASLRGGADQWDNPRYRAMLIVFESLVAAFAWVHRDRWLTRWVFIEVIFLAIFTQWYAFRYYHVGIEISFGIMVALIFALAALILGAGWWRDKHRNPPP